MEVNIPEVVAEVEAAFARYEAALVGNNVPVLDELFWDGPHTIRYGIGENLYGPAEIAAFRASRSPAGLSRRLSRTVITSYGRDMAVAADGWDARSIPYTQHLGRRSEHPNPPPSRVGRGPTPLN